MNETTALKTPLRYFEGYIADADNKFVAMLTVSDYSHEEDDANGAAIVRCVNSHAQMLEALEATTRALVVIRRRLQTATGEAQQSAMAELERRIARGESAIEKARSS